MIKLSPKKLLMIHMDCLFTYQNERMVHVNEPWGCTAPAPLLMVGHTTEDDILYRFGQTADTDFIRKAESLLFSGIWDISAYSADVTNIASLQLARKSQYALYAGVFVLG